MTDGKLLVLHSNTWNHFIVWKNELRLIIHYIFDIYVLTGFDIKQPTTVDMP